MKFTKSHEKALKEFMSKMDDSGCVVCEDWVSGKGRFTSPRVLPPFVTKEEKGQTTNKTANFFFKKNTRRKYVLVLDKEAMFDFLFNSAKGNEF